MKRGLRRFTEEKREQIKKHPYFAQWRENVLKKAEEYLNTEPPRIKYSDMHSYYLTGKRSDARQQGVYHTRMHTFFIAYMLTEDEKYLVPLADDLWNICDFECWTGPWHIKESEALEDRFTELDLGSTGLGANIAEILYFVGDKLPELVYRRAKDQVTRRIINSYRDKTNEEIYWFYRNTNWSAFCTCQVFLCYYYLATDEELMAQIPRMLTSMDCYLSGLDDEGCCIEGYGYWNYGFGEFCMFADLLRDYTEGKINLFDNEKVHMVALFQQKIAMNEKECLSFSDCGRGFKPYAPLSHLLKSIYSDIEIPSIKAADHALSLRELVCQEPSLANSEFKPKSHSFKNAQWFVYHGDKYSLGAKAGHNKETHNHNDVGSFMFSKEGKISFCDLGSGEYVADYFGANRYNILVCSSRGHSVPIINGKLQEKNVDDKATVIEQSDNTFRFAYGKVYDDPTLKKFERGFECLEDRLILTDTFEFDSAPESLVERFVSDLEIRVEKGKLICHHTTLEYDPDVFEASVEAVPFNDAPGHGCTAYLADLKVKNPKSDMTLKFVIK